MRFRDAFDRLTADTIKDVFLGNVSADLLSGIEHEMVGKIGKLREMTLKLIEPYEMILDNKMREEIIKVLSCEESKILVNELKLKSSKKTHDLLVRCRIQKGSEREGIVLAFFGIKKPDVETIVVQPNVENVEPQMGLFEHQRNVVNNAIKLLDGESDRLLIHMPTGSGKTRIAMRIIVHYLLKAEARLVIWLAYSEELCEQAIEEFRETWKRLGDRTVNVHRFFGKHTIEKNRLPVDGILVAGLDKMYRADTSGNRSLFLPKLADNTDLVIMDEAHQAVAKTYKYVLKQLTGRREGQKLLGLTATPGRMRDGSDTDKKLPEFFHKCKVTLNEKDPIKFLVKKGYLANVKIESLEYPNKFSAKEIQKIETELEIPKDVLEKLAINVRRSLVILSLVQKLISEGHKRIILFAATVEHAKALAAGLTAKGVNAQYITSDTPSDVRGLRIRNYKEEDDKTRVICNYGVLTTGFDAPRTSAAIIARPTKSLVLYSQMAGRAMRGPKAGGNEESKIISVVDIKLAKFRDVSKGFLGWEDLW